MSDELPRTSMAQFVSRQKQINQIRISAVINVIICILVFICAYPRSLFADAKPTQQNGSNKMELSLTEQLAYSTVRIEVIYPDGRHGTGTGFFFSLLADGNRNVPVIVTNWHVVAGSQSGSFSISLADDNGFPKEASYDSIKLEKFEQRWMHHPNPNIDLAIMPIADVLNEANNKGLRLFYRSLDKTLIPSDADLADLTAVEDILMVGYPIGLWDSHNNYPIFRKGITATHPAKNYNAKKEFVIDAACFPGSSGSPVFLADVGSYTNRRHGGFVC